MAFAKREGRAELQDTLLALPSIQNSRFKIAAGVPIQISECKIENRNEDLKSKIQKRSKIQSRKSKIESKIENPKFVALLIAGSLCWSILLVLLAEPNPEMYYLHRRKPGCDIYLEINEAGELTPFPNRMEASWDMR
jgi:hypothetical protein